MNIVFTGPAIDNSGKLILRANLTQACIQKGNLVIQPAIGPDTDLLVASRSDTVKAKRAAALGIAVFSYPEFITRFLKGVEIPTGGLASKFTDKVDADMLVPNFVEWDLLEVIDHL